MPRDPMTEVATILVRGAARSLTPPELDQAIKLLQRVDPEEREEAGDGMRSSACWSKSCGNGDASPVQADPREGEG